MTAIRLSKGAPGQRQEDNPSCDLRRDDEQKYNRTHQDPKKKLIRAQHHDQHQRPKHTKQERAATRPPQAPNYFAAFPFGVTVNANAST